jgi:hypothetical protein
MTKRQTIRLLRKVAKLWDEAKPSPAVSMTGAYVSKGTKYADGLCITFALLGCRNHPILDRLPPRRVGSCYCWSHGKSGAEARARWCRKIADKLERGEINVD